MKKQQLLILLLTPILILYVIVPSTSALSGSQFQAGQIVDDNRFYTGPTMSVAEIQAFLNAKVPICDTNHAPSGSPRDSGPPYTCLKDYTDSTIGWPAEAGLCSQITGRTGNAAEIIYWVSDACGISTNTLIVLLQKEQSLVTDTWPWNYQYRFATGFCVYDTGPPPPGCAGTEGFFGQLYYAARQFKKYKKNPENYGYRAGFNNNILWHPNSGLCGSSTVYIQNAATAGLYNYTPYRPNQAALNNLYGTGDNCSSYGNRNFWRMHNDWFGSTTGPPDYSCRNGSNIGGAGSGGKVIANQFSPASYSTFTLGFLNQTGSQCAELHTWNNSLQGWITNVASNYPAIDPSYAEIISGNLYGDAKSELIFVLPRTSGSGRVEVHTWDPTYQRWASNVATNHPLIDPSDFDVVASDTNGDGIDELVFVKYRHTGSGRIEVHTWGVNQQSWISNVATNHPEIDSADATVISGNLYGDARDELILVKYRNTGSGRVEVHTWAAGQQNWLSNIATNHPTVNPTDAAVIAGNVYDGSIDELAFVKYRNTGSGRVEVHTWAAGQQNWLSNIATNHGAL